MHLIDRIEAKYPGGVVEGSGSDRYIPEITSDWKHRNPENIVTSVLAEMGDQPWPGSDHLLARDAVDQYIENFSGGREVWQARSDD
ncbi:hypothetical protein ABZ635_16030 [Nocardiopsis sp. NPDC007018]|uniref:hypothetical protein n=1 Tax=Nocardiopsis sp. NPDC007018 TaxID=3155721 RepID=UPI0034096F54